MTEVTSPLVLLSGPSCSGKSSIANALQELTDDPVLHVGLDSFEAMQPSKGGRRIHAFYGQRGDGTWDRERDLVHVFHICLAAFAEAGARVVAEHIFLRRRWLKDAVLRLEGVPVLSVGVQCPVAELERREREREGRNPSSGQAARQSRQLSPLDALAPYDLILNTADLGPEECVDRIRQRLATGPPTAFARLRRSPFFDEQEPPAQE